MEKVSFDPFGIGPTYEIEFIIEFDLSLGDKAAGAIVNIQPRPNQLVPYSMKTLDEYAIFIRQVWGIMAKFKFELIDEYQSDDSYSYYIEFLPRNIYGDLMPIKMRSKFRISDHELPIGSGSNNTEDGRVFRSFNIGPNAEYKSQPALLDGVEFVCDLIMQERYEDILRVYGATII